jgi:adenylosuccinate synthase
MTQQLPTGMINKDATLLLGPGAIINPTLLLQEIRSFNERFGIMGRLMIHPRAAVVTQTDKERESLGLVHNASTRKGTGSALSRKITRFNEWLPRIADECNELFEYVTTQEIYDQVIREAHLVQIESAQGLELSLNRGTSYPYCTSRDVVPEQILADVAVSYRDLERVYAVIRTFPIRVGNEYDAMGNELGNSGPVYDDMKEISWDDLSIDLMGKGGTAVKELTTVTKKVRRIFTFSETQYQRMLRTFGPVEIFLNYVNYLDPSAHKVADLDMFSTNFIYERNDVARQFGSRIKYVGFGPAYQNVEEWK